MLEEKKNVEEFYDEFTKKRLIHDFHIYNKRQHAFIKICNRCIPANKRILEIGCGTGIITKNLQKKASFLLAIDISKVNIKVAEMYVKGSNITQFKVLDIVKNSDELKKYPKFDCIVMADVIEHLPKSFYKQLFSLFENILSEDGLVIISFPSPEYQYFLKTQDPNSLQVIDETVMISDVLNSTSLHPYYFSYKNIWGNNQYIHFILKHKLNFQPFVYSSLFEKIIYRIEKYKWRFNNYFFYTRLKKLFRNN